MTNKFRGTFIFFGLLLGISQAVAQRNELGGGIGAFNYRGEISPSINPLFSRPGGILFYKRNFSPVVSLRFGVSLGSLYADERSSKQPVAQLRRAKFSGFLTEVSAMAEYNFLNYILSYKERKSVSKFTPYLTGGLAFFNAQTDSNIEGSQTDQKSKLAVPMGVGIKYMITDQWNLIVEGVARKTFTDKLDGVSNTMISNKVVGDTEDNDVYYYLGFSISYTFYKVHCPTR